MDGIVNVMKPAGMTSHDVVAKLRRVYHTKKVGHTGTLDPDAIGVLPICVGQATRLVEYFTEKDKTYKVIMKFGNETTTQDSSGEVTITTELPTLSKAEFCAVTEQFIGEIQQVPPMYSAIKKDGQPLYKLAREGVEVEIEPRPVTIHGIKVLMYNKESAMLEVHCGKGTYIRTLCQDLARACGSSAHMTYLMRLSSGDFNIADAVPLARLEQSETPEQFLQGMNDCLHAMPAVTVTDKKMMERIVNGLSQKAQGAESLAEGTVCRAVTQEGVLLAIGTIINQAFQPNKVFKCGE
ncbi:MAG: tRNA pseudouridine(55) synthase TruB [Peptococcaceae bacterium]|jgi:tRNA pseudouridine55 synthase|nr:tRNA pseudouridine(55) synthase TruB [Peptococcaceae bacterium]MBQ2021430.1 tRNA pseudouridine(55) synthase TruB [Peptococcaceae bacterium]MBQ5369315.1 tRNA pseudouridine(55) synthase TruB [Peptococcaceae bacterium]MBQ5658595.1 tRNA pseudouridine(55) synthase TruB [Peptococcaceae bacterium]MBQ5707049.1 tRNA pseudouridine(55) synthase TruB [Peptococcaceae bacterium]